MTSPLDRVVTESILVASIGAVDNHIQTLMRKKAVLQAELDGLRRLDQPIPFNWATPVTVNVADPQPAAQAKPIEVPDPKPSDVTVLERAAQWSVEQIQLPVWVSNALKKAKIYNLGMLRIRFYNNEKIPGIGITAHRHIEEAIERYSHCS